jgi:hypothetical protein
MLRLIKNVLTWLATSFATLVLTVYLDRPTLDKLLDASSIIDWLTSFFTIPVPSWILFLSLAALLGVTWVWGAAQGMAERLRAKAEEEAVPRIVLSQEDKAIIAVFGHQPDPHALLDFECLRQWTKIPVHLLQHRLDVLVEAGRLHLTWNTNAETVYALSPQGRKDLLAL